MQFGVVMNHLGIQNRPFWTVYICEMEGKIISIFSYLQTLNEAVTGTPPPGCYVKL